MMFLLATSTRLQCLYAQRSGLFLLITVSQAPSIAPDT